jgi:hypothetical protein
MYQEPRLGESRFSCYEFDEKPTVGGNQLKFVKLNMLLKFKNIVLPSRIHPSSKAKTALSDRIILISRFCMKLSEAIALP